MKNGLYCSGGYDWMSVGSDGEAYVCNCLQYIKNPNMGYLGNMIENDLVLSIEEFHRCPVQQCEQMCDRHWSRKRVYRDDMVVDFQDILNDSTYKGKTRPVSILWAPTWNCNYTCKYCRFAIPSKEKVYPYERWLDAFARFIEMNSIDGGLFHVAGGEPLYYEGIENIFFAMFKSGFKIGLTTNLSMSAYDKIIRLVPPDGITAINASLHATDKRFDWDMFRSRVMLLKQFGYTVSVNFVAHPDQIMLTEEYHDYFTSRGVPFALIPLAGWRMGKYPKVLRSILEKYVSNALDDDSCFKDGRRVLGPMSLTILQ